MGLGAPEIVIIAVVAILLFGATKLPVFAKSLGESLRIFKKELKSSGDDGDERRGSQLPPALPPVLADGARPAEAPREVATEPTQRTESR
ncbi:MAG: twin-arginine translocase TatA/TatE family subunit [Frankiaceae bacterium]